MSLCGHRGKTTIEASSSLDHADRAEPCDLFGQAGIVHNFHDPVYVLVGIGLFLG
jgi:hypothetical protein